MSMMVSTVKIWQKNWASYTTKDVVALADIKHDIEQSGYDCTVYNDMDEEATLIRVSTHHGVFDIGPCFTSTTGELIAYKESLSVYFDGSDNNETNAIKGHLASILES